MMFRIMFWIQGNIPCPEAHWEDGGEKLLLQTFAYGMFYFLQAKTPWNALRHSYLLVKCFHLNTFSGRKNKQKLNYAKMHMQGEGKSSQFYPQIQGPCFRLHWFLLE